MTTTIQALEEYTLIDETEHGEAGSHLVALSAYQPYLSEEFFGALSIEIERQLSDYRRSCEIVEKEETITQFVKFLEWIE